MCMNTLSIDNVVKNAIEKLFENCVCIDTMDAANNIALATTYGYYANIVFDNTLLKDSFIDKLSSIRPDINVINCNCTINSFFENSFDGFLVFNNLKRCKHLEIIEEIKRYKGILIC